jgi:arylsulfatase A-like enzyme
VLGRGGYRTQAIGKCHFTPDRDALRGFQARRRQEEGVADPRRDDYVAWLAANRYDYYEPHGARSDMYYIPQVSPLPAEAHPTQWVGDESVRFIRAQTAGGPPWCLFTSFVHPHPPFAPPKPWHKLYRVPDMPLPFVPENVAELTTWVNRHQNRYKYRDRGVDLNLIRLIKAYYYATISFVDFQVGRLLETLEQTGQLAHTLILFTSDHGELLGDLLCFGKRSMHDASARVPLIVRYPPRFEPGRLCTTAVSLVDVMPTVLAAAGIGAAPLALDGRDLAGVAADPPAERTVFSQYQAQGRALHMAVNEAWKYVYSAGDDREFLFDRRRDPRETHNVANDPAGAAAKAALKAEYLRYAQAQGQADTFIETGAGLDWRRYPRVDERYLEDPDAELLFQDHPSYPLNLPGYHEIGPMRGGRI